MKKKKINRYYRKLIEEIMEEENRVYIENEYLCRFCSHKTYCDKTFCFYTATAQAEV